MKFNLPVLGDIDFNSPVVQQIIALITSVLLSIVGSAGINVSELKAQIPDNAPTLVKDIGTTLFDDPQLGETAGQLTALATGSSEKLDTVEVNRSRAAESTTVVIEDPKPTHEEVASPAIVFAAPSTNLPQTDQFMVANFPKADAADNPAPVVFSFVEKVNDKITPVTEGTWSGTIAGRDISEMRAETDRPLDAGILALSVKPSELSDINIRFDSNNYQSGFASDHIDLDRDGQTTLFTPGRSS
ncbi:hypothetical protein N7326_00800 [Corynebacterium sp. ES2794-CONJ1]|uniref:hypothetical protein n=1 Tax=unclassified Corynebacterium TaxID=2624378 RepID=UPI0021682189|nr:MULTISPECIES: hypothetical protein [unclassified Corynebacterium]MCS4489261.1 hypothetical protein [Corynebacterium sp. ES2775-CONJ]MCS4531045.1 hypothetical protein [Corynebacterium sp. ES2730-CONJ]MCU9518412.1 hypothetical protein [Corynebacterium sp. ES2794-CONJ1]